MARPRLRPGLRDHLGRDTWTAAGAGRTYTVARGWRYARRGICKPSYYISATEGGQPVQVPQSTARSLREAGKLITGWEGIRVDIKIRIGSEYRADSSAEEAVTALRQTDGQYVHVTAVHGDGQPVFGVEAEVKPWSYGFSEVQPPMVTWSSIGAQHLEVVRAFTECLRTAADLAALATVRGRIMAKYEVRAYCG